MTYSHDLYFFDEKEALPPPPPYLVWMEDIYRDSSQNGGKRTLVDHPMDKSRKVDVRCKGQVRHLANLSKARRYIRERAIGYGGKNRIAWALYAWNDKRGAWDILDAQGRGGDVTSSPVVGKAMRAPRSKKSSDRDLDAAIASIRAEIERIEN